MQLPPLNGSISSTPNPAQLSTSTAELKALGLTAEQPTVADVKQVLTLRPEQRQMLIEHSEQQLKQLLKNTQIPDKLAQVNKLIDQIELLKTPALKLLELSVNGRPLLTYTAQPITTGQQLLLQLGDGQRLQLIALPNEQRLAQVNTNQSNLAQTQINPKIDALLAATTQTVRSTENDKQTLTPLTAKPINVEALTNALKKLLPQKEFTSELFQALPQLQSLLTSSRQTLLSGSVEQALKTLANQLRSPAQLSNPSVLPTMIKNTGVFFEQKLLQQAAPLLSTPNSNPIKISPALTLMAQQDLKGALLALTDITRRELASFVNPSTASEPATALPSPASGYVPISLDDSGAPRLPNLLPFIQMLSRLSTSELSNKVLRQQLVMLIQQHAMAGLNKIQLQQFHSLNHQKNETDSLLPTQSWQLEIPIRLAAEIHPLEWRIDQSWHKADDEESDNQTSEKIPKWSVMLKFNLPIIGGFYSQITVINEALSASLWAEQPHTLVLIKEHAQSLQQRLEAQGITVTQLQCFAGKPPEIPMALNYSLVDVKT